MLYLPSRRVRRSVEAWAEMPVRRPPLAAAAAAVTPGPRVDTTSLLAAESAPACARAAAGDFCAWGTAFLSLLKRREN